jgi:cysteine desulfurase/selenocysteine lyase
MATTDLTGATQSAADAEPAAAGVFLPDAGAIERLANALFQSVTGGAPITAPAVPASPPAPWSAPSRPSAPVYAGALPLQPAFGVPDLPTSGVPSSVPLRSFGGASAGSASPFAFAQSRSLAPAATQTAIAAPRIDPMRSTPGSFPLQDAASPSGDGGFEPSPFSAPIDFGSALRALDVLARPNTAASSAVGHVQPASSSIINSAPAGDAALPTPAGAVGSAPSPAIAPVFTEASLGTRTFDAASIRNDFPILRERVHGRRLIWLDNGATTQKPQAVIDRLAAFYTHENSNIRRAAHTLAARATDAYEAARDKVRRFVNASSPREIVFVRGATEGINLVAQSWGRRNVKAGDEIVVTWLEHHANIVPWQQLCLETGAKLRVAPVDDNGDVRLDEYEKLLGPRTRLVALTQVSNALGTVTPAREMIEAAHRHGALTLVDGAQSVAHQRTDVQALGADFFVLSGHKMFAPTGIGAVYGKQAILETMPPWQGGGAMIADVTFERTVYQSPPDRFEAGTGNIADAVGLGAAIDYLDAIGIEAIARHEHDLITETVVGLRAIPGLRLVGAPRERAGVVSFVLDGCRTEDVGKALDREGIAVRAGHHCAQPILRRFGLESSVRPSFALYNTPEDVEALIAAVRRIALQAQGSSRP